jgi:hypothetical protein
LFGTVRCNRNRRESHSPRRAGAARRSPLPARSAASTRKTPFPALRAEDMTRRASPALQGNRVNKRVMTRERLPFRPSPDKGRTGGVGRAEIRVLCMIDSPNPPHSPLVRGEVARVAVGFPVLRLHGIVLYEIAGIRSSDQRLPFRPSPDKGRTGGVGRGEIRVLCMIRSAKPPSIPPCQGGSRELLHWGCRSSRCP